MKAPKSRARPEGRREDPWRERAAALAAAGCERHTDCQQNLELGRRCALLWWQERLRTDQTLRALLVRSFDGLENVRKFWHYVGIVQREGPFPTRPAPDPPLPATTWSRDPLPATATTMTWSRDPTS